MIIKKLVLLIIIVSMICGFSTVNISADSYDAVLSFDKTPRIFLNYLFCDVKV